MRKTARSEVVPVCHSGRALAQRDKAELEAVKQLELARGNGTPLKFAVSNRGSLLS